MDEELESLKARIIGQVVNQKQKKSNKSSNEFIEQYRIVEELARKSGLEKRERVLRTFIGIDSSDGADYTVTIPLLPPPAVLDLEQKLDKLSALLDGLKDIEDEPQDLIKDRLVAISSTCSRARKSIPAAHDALVACEKMYKAQTSASEIKIERGIIAMEPSSRMPRKHYFFGGFGNS